MHRILSAIAIVGLALQLTYLEFRIHELVAGSQGFFAWFDRAVAPGILLGVVLLLRGGPRWVTLGLGGLGLTLTLLGNLASIEYAGDPLSSQRTAAAGQLWTIRSSIAALIGVEGLAMLTATVVAPAILWWWERRTDRGTRPPRSRPLLLLAGAILTTAILRLVILWIGFAPAANVREVVMEHGALMHHVLELRHAPDAGAPPGSLTPGMRKSLQGTLAHRALLNRTPSPFFGIAKGRHVHFVQLEAFEHFLLDLHVPAGPVTPTLNKLAATGLRWRGMLNLAMRGRSSDSEFSAMTSLLAHPTKTVSLEFEDKVWAGLPRLLGERGYRTYSFHPYVSSFWNRVKMHPGYGIQAPHFDKEFKPGRNIGWGLCDEDFLLQAADIVAAGPAPYMALYTTLTSHHPFSALPEELLNWPVGPIESGQVANYLRITHYTDQALGKWLESLRRQGQLDRSILVFYGDHNAGFTRRGRQAVQKLTGEASSDHDTDRVLLVIAIPGKEEFLVAHRDAFADILGGSQDLAPTVLHLLGLESPAGFFGTHLFVPAEKREPLLLATGRNFLHHGAIHPIAAADQILSPAERDSLFSQPRIARALIEQTGSPLFRELQSADDATLRKLAAARDTTAMRDGEEAGSPAHSTEAAPSFPRIEYPSGELFQHLRDVRSRGGFSPQFVAIGGGTYQGLRSSNTLDALRASAAAGYRAIQVDLAWTTDDQLVLLTDWQAAKARFFQGGPGRLSLAQFHAQPKIHDTTHLALAEFVAWVDENPDIQILFRARENAAGALARIRKDHPDHRERLQPWVSDVGDYDRARRLGFTRVWLEVDPAADPAAFLSELAERSPLAVVLPDERRDLAVPLNARRIPTFARQINGRYEWQTARAQGLHGCLTDELGINHLEGEPPRAIPTWRVEFGTARPLGYRMLPNIPDARFRWESGPDLDLVNDGSQPQSLRLRALDRAGKLVAERTVRLAPGDATRAWVRQLFLRAPGRLLIDGGPVRAQAFWGAEDQTRSPLRVYAAAHDQTVITGSTEGVHGYSLGIVNPFDTAATVTLTRSGAATAETIRIAPGETIVRGFAIPPGQKSVRVEVRGDFVVVQSMHWDGELRTVREF